MSTANESPIQAQKIAPWYRQFWAWFVFGPLIVTVIVCLVFVGIAVVNRDDLVNDDYYNVGRAINKDFDEEHRAKELGIAAHIELHPAQKILTLNLQGKTAATQRVVVDFLHPFREALDAHVEMQEQSSALWQAPIPEKLQRRWYLHVSGLGADGKIIWRLNGELDLRSSLSADLQ